MTNKKGMFIVFEGIDGSGKSTQIKKFVEYLFNLDKHNHIILTRNPYKETDIRNILKEDTDPNSRSEKLAELFIKDRFQQANELIIPNIKNGHFVISDRHKMSTLSYQTAQGMDLQDLIKKHDNLPIPDITFVIDLPIEIANQRMAIEAERDEHKFESNLEFLEKVRQNYVKLKDLIVNEKIFIINGNNDPTTIHQEIVNIFKNEILNKGIKNNQSQSNQEDIYKSLIEEINKLRQRIDNLEKTN